MTTLSFTGKHIEITEAIKDFINDQHDRIEDKFNINKSHLSFEKDSSHIYKVTCKSELINGESFTSTDKNKDLYVAISEAYSKIMKQMKKCKDKSMTRKKSLSKVDEELV